MLIAAISILFLISGTNFDNTIGQQQSLAVEEGDTFLFTVNQYSYKLENVNELWFINTPDGAFLQVLETNEANLTFDTFSIAGSANYSAGIPESNFSVVIEDIDYNNPLSPIISYFLEKDSNHSYQLIDYKHYSNHSYQRSYWSVIEDYFINFLFANLDTYAPRTNLWFSSSNDLGKNFLLYILPVTGTNDLLWTGLAQKMIPVHDFFVEESNFLIKSKINQFFS